MILGKTDPQSWQPRWTGKIRAGKKDPNNPKKLINTTNFLLHDAQQLIPDIGNDPTEIYFTVHSDNKEAFFPTDLRWYNANELICKSMHGHPHPATGKPMGRVAAFFKNGVEVQGLSQQQFPGLLRARLRQCGYETCPDFVSENCGEHFFLHMVIPQHSMGAIFTLDNTSYKGMMNLNSVFGMAAFKWKDKLSGQIFRLYKRKEPGSFLKDNGSRGKTEVDVVMIDPVDFDWYTKTFREKIRPEDWERLCDIRNSAPVMTAPQISAPDDVPLIGSDESFETQTQPALTGAAETAEQKEAAILAVADNPSVAPMFAELALLLGKENAQHLRVQTARHYTTLPSISEYLAKRIREEKKKAKTTPKPAAAATPPTGGPQTQQPPVGGQQPPPQQVGAADNRPLF